MSRPLLERLSALLVAGDARGVVETTESAISQEFTPAEILDKGLLAGMTVVGDRFRNREIFLPDVLMSARAMQSAMTVLKPLLVRDGVPPAGKVVLGTVSGDLHDIGKNLVGILLQGAGFEVIDLGTDVPAEQFVDAALESGAPVIGMSALLTTTMPEMANVIRLARARAPSERIRTIVGGAPLTAPFALEIGADAYAPDAATAVETIRGLITTP